MAKIPFKVKFYDNIFKYPIFICAFIAVSLGGSYFLSYGNYYREVVVPIEVMTNSDEEYKATLERLIKTEPDVKDAVDTLNFMKYGAIISGVGFVVFKIFNYAYEINERDKCNNYR